jgi:hypothetical protein
MELRRACEKNGVYNLALPRELGAGLENLPEKYIKDALFTVFQGIKEENGGFYYCY